MKELFELVKDGFLTREAAFILIGAWVLFYILLKLKHLHDRVLDKKVDAAQKDRDYYKERFESLQKEFVFYRQNLFARRQKPKTLKAKPKTTVPRSKN